MDSSYEQKVARAPANSARANVDPRHNRSPAFAGPGLPFELSTTIFESGSSTLPDIEVWTVNHFSRYMLASD